MTAVTPSGLPVQQIIEELPQPSNEAIDFLDNIGRLI